MRVDPHRVSSSAVATHSDVEEGDELRITFLEPYPAPRQGAALGGPRYRDEALVSELRGLGHDLAPFTATVGASRTERDVFGTVWNFVSAAPFELGDHHARWLSPELVRRALDSDPQALIVRAAGTRIGALVQSGLDVPTVTILGGMSRTTTVLDSDLLLTESTEQERYFRIRVGERRLLRLPKLPSQEFLDQPVIPIGNRATDIVVVSMFKEHKNHRALAPLFAHDLDIALIGDGPTRGAIENLAMGSTARVDFLGALVPRDVAAVVANSRLLVHPSISEGFPRVVAEAMAVGTPTLALKGVVGEPLDDGRNGLAVDIADLDAAVIDLVGDVPRIERLSAASRTTFEREFGPEALSRAAVELSDRLAWLCDRPMAARQMDLGARRVRKGYWTLESGLRRRVKRLRATISS